MSKVQELVIQQVTENLKKLQYGTIAITVHDGEVTQVDVTEKNRFPALKKGVK